MRVYYTFLFYFAHITRRIDNTRYINWMVTAMGLERWNDTCRMEANILKSKQITNDKEIVCL